MVKTEKEQEYFVICLEEKSREGTLLFWKPEGKGYTSSLKEAGLFDKKFAGNMNNKGRDIALTKKELEAICFMKIYTVVDCPLNELIEKKGGVSK